MKYVITGRGGFIDFEITGDVFCCSIAWIDKFCPPTFTLPGVGVVECPVQLVRSTTATLIPNLQLKIITHESSLTV